eukprot:CCRYP_012336-RA/>CCRYP_012336-RA protein AED:0.33 eAED:0.33 QI:0/-1/0/1/-1/1/1/0/158
MYVIPPTAADVTELDSVASSIHEVGFHLFVDETEASDIPTFVYLQEDSHSVLSTLGENCGSIGMRLSKTANVLNTRPESLHEVSQCHSDKDEQQSKISNSDLEDMKRMIQDIKSNPDLIYKRLCVRYDESIIQRGNASMLQMEMRCNDKVTVPTSALT